MKRMSVAILANDSDNADPGEHYAVTWNNEGIVYNNTIEPINIITMPIGCNFTLCGQGESFFEVHIYIGTDDKYEGFKWELSSNNTILDSFTNPSTNTNVYYDHRKCRQVADDECVTLLRTDSSYYCNEPDDDYYDDRISNIYYIVSWNDHVKSKGIVECEGTSINLGNCY